ncbi:hypothetical protein KW798_01970 [Candidatus Parcubacteria bacterium]|nr:hypothetical protein [Candidatus Parcubacteria bacterium]
MDQNQQGQKPQSLSWSQPSQSNTQQSPKLISNPPPKNPSMHPAIAAVQHNYGRGALTGSFVVGLIIGVLLGWTWFSLRNDSASGDASATPTATSTKTSTSSTKTTTTKTPTSAPTTVSNSNGIKVTPVTSLQVDVANVSVTKPTWVVVYDNVKGAPGNALGARLFFPMSKGGTTSGSITLLRGTVSGKEYFVGQNVDNGDGKFSKQSDKAVVDSGGKAVVLTFTAK